MPAFPLSLCLLLRVAAAAFQDRYPVACHPISRIRHNIDMMDHFIMMLLACRSRLVLLWRG